MAFKRINDILIHHQSIGPVDGPALVFINSLGTDFRIWDTVVPAFSDRFRVVLYDKRGHGLSDAPGGDYTIEDHANDVIGLLDHLGIEKFSVVGLSVGGFIAQQLALSVPDRIEAVVLCDTAVKIGDAAAWNGRIDAVRAGGIESIAPMILERWFTEPFRATEECEGYSHMLVRTPVNGYIGTCAALRDGDFRTEASRIKAPVLCVVGDKDGSTPPDLVRAMADLIPGARFEIIKDAGHLPNIEQPEALIRLMADHLKASGLA
ncbi:3-oxoadipate enol-lactonase [Rhodoligotrophos appendicifer]|uniref:3-oxoadipate enol-lactonase n=1 Tax=Rhodoligotrophos appendicifer TaxID=987056 RepID=UPI00117F1F3F|nr:3-oxoadipate enol-lactonase [Rhodoligotrophos appendicifer]